MFRYKHPNMEEKFINALDKSKNIDFIDGIEFHHNSRLQRKCVVMEGVFVDKRDENVTEQ